MDVFYNKLEADPSTIGMDVVGGRLDMVSATSIKWGFQNSNQIRLVNPDTGRWELVKVATEPTIANTALDLNGTALAPNTIYDVFAEYDSSTAFDLVLSRWATGGDGANNASTSYATPVMTADNAPGPITTSATSIYASNAELSAYYAFNQSDGNSDTIGVWISNAAPSSGSPQSLMIDFGQPVCINKYVLKTRNATTTGYRAFPKTWTLEGSNSGAIGDTAGDTNGTNGWYLLDTVAASTDPGAASTWEAAYHTFVNNKSFQKYRIRITDRYGSEPYVAINELKLVAASNSLAGGSSRTRAYESTVTYYKGDRVTYGGHDWVKQSSAAAGTTPVAGNDWVDNGTSVSGDFSGLYRHDGVLVSDSSTTGKSRRWLGIIYTYNNGGTVNFKDDVNYRYISNYYNPKEAHVQCSSSGVALVNAVTAYTELSGATRGYFVLSSSQSCLIKAKATFVSITGAGASVGMGVNSTSVNSVGVHPGNGVSNDWITFHGFEFKSIATPGYNFITQLCANSSGGFTSYSCTGEVFLRR